MGSVKSRSKNVLKSAKNRSKNVKLSENGKLRKWEWKKMEIPRKSGGCPGCKRQIVVCGAVTRRVRGFSNVGGVVTTTCAKNQLCGILARLSA